MFVMQYLVSIICFAVIFPRIEPFVFVVFFFWGGGGGFALIVLDL